MPSLTDHIVFNDKKLEQKYANGGRMPMADLYEAYFDGDIDIPGDIYAFLNDRKLFVTNTLTKRHFKWAITHFVPEAVIHSKSQDERIVREHYDRGNDFFGWFLGERMVYTSAFFQNPGESLEQAQDNKLNLVCKKLQLDKGNRLLDIGCGWGTLTRHAARYYGADATGVTISKNQTEFGNGRIKEWGLEDRARILCKDYRDIPAQKFDRIVSLEMVEHVGVKNLVSFYEQVQDLLTDEGLFLLAVDRATPRFPPRGPDLDPVHGQVHFPGRRRELATLVHAESDGEGWLGVAQRRERQHPLRVDDPSLARQLAQQSRRRGESLRRALVPHLALLPGVVDDHREARQRRLLSGRAQQEPGRLRPHALGEPQGHRARRPRALHHDTRRTTTSPRWS